ncbi:hypothetical protein [Parachlamydia sp. AcF125]|uniref:hypothetical protein n=1 Tax=Parachlamydia sp. AcF125 TaxID=2795736 RepID=UPI002016344D|nr:hypothetical protein [Parachlamydia sp. AcF125]
MNKKNHTEEEVQSVLEDFSQPSPQVYDLAQESPHLQAQAELTEENNEIKLKNLLSIQQLIEKHQSEQHEIQRKLDLALQQLEHYDDSFALLQEENSQLKQMQKINSQNDDKKMLEKRLSESHKHAEQLDRVIHFLRERLEEANLEARQLKEDYQKSQDLLLETTSEKEHVKSLLAEEQQAKTEALEEVAALSDQFSALKNHVYEAERKLQEIQQELDTYKDRERSLREEAAGLQHVKTELEAALQKETQLSHQVKAQSHEILTKFTQLKEEVEQLQSHTDQAALAHLAISSQLAQSQELLKEKEIKLKEIQQSLNAHTEEKQKHDQILVTLQAQIQELEASLQSAELHLAKKVREIALYQESYEEQKLNLQGMENTHRHDEEKIVELQQKIDASKQVEAQLEKRAKQWEQQYLEMHEKWQKAEIRNEELKTVEIKHNQMQTILKNLEALIGSPLLPPTETEKNVSLSFNHEPKQISEPSLFDLKDYAFSKPRDTFFD